jgi:hypothetical protein
VHSVALLSIQQYIVQVNSFEIRVSSPRWRVTVATACGVWIVAALYTVSSTLSQFLCEEFESLHRIMYYQLVVMYELLVSCLFPLWAIACTYNMTARHPVERSYSISKEKETPQLKTHRNVAKIMVGLTVVFLISYVPYHVFWTYIICTAKP